MVLQMSKCLRSLSSSAAHGRSLILLETCGGQWGQTEQIDYFAVESLSFITLEMLKCHWGRHWIIAGSGHFNLTFLCVSPRGTNTAITVTIVPVEFRFLSLYVWHVAALGTSLSGSNVQGQMSLSLTEQLNVKVLWKWQGHKSTSEGLKVCVPSRKASVNPQSLLTDSCLHPSPACSWWLPLLPRRCWSCSALAPPCCPSPAETARLVRQSREFCYKYSD